MEKLVELNAFAALNNVLVEVLENNGAAVADLRAARNARAAAEMRAKDELIFQDPAGYEKRLRKQWG